jgi:hypothetical protein
MRPGRLVFILLVASGAGVMAQNKPVTTSSSSKSATASTRVLPTIKCDDHDSAVACKSFKQLIDARDSGVLFGIMGDPEDAGRHFAYVCPRRGADTFTIVEFTVAEKKKFRPFASFASMGNDEFKQTIAGAMLGRDPAHPLSLFAINQFSQDHRDGILYAQGSVALASYQDGELAGLQIESGEWSQSTKSVGSAHDDSYAAFSGGHYWIQTYNETISGEPPEVDDPTNLHLYLDGRVVYAHYGYKNRDGDFIDYVIQIHRSTGRFTETFKLPADRSDDTGTCMIFKY